MGYKTFDSGRVLYVATTGSVNSAKIGDITRPFPTPQDARDAATNGDLIYVMPGTYTYGNQGSGANYEGTTANNNEEISLNYGTTNMSYHFEPGATMQSVGSAPVALIYEPFGVAVESPSTIKITGGLIIDTTGTFINITYRDSKWDIEFDKVLNCNNAIRTDANYSSAGGIEDIIYFERLTVKGNEINCSADPIILSFSGNVTASDGRIGMDRGYVDIDVKRIISSAGIARFGYIYNYDVNFKVDYLKCSWGFIMAIKDTVLNIDINTWETQVDSQGGFEEFCAMTDGEIHFNLKTLVRPSGGTPLYAFLIRNNFGTGGKVFLNVESVTSDNCIVLQQASSVDSRVTLHNGGFEGETQLQITGNFIEVDAAEPVIDISGTSFTDGDNGNVRLKLKNSTLITDHTNSIVSTFSKNVIVQNVTSNKATDANTTEVGDSITVSTEYVF